MTGIGRFSSQSGFIPKTSLFTEDDGSALSTPFERRHQPLMPVMVMDVTKLFWKNAYTTIIGMTDSTLAAIRKP